ncbi:hypothetical protein [Armatimonas sp.]|uniref:hypothetical protein n=1 Tax=Armatimonas sp. TaxID=1872638 RepID=UPI00286D4A05|nr:hypothetical protein [Armatimonas sp.]
MKRFIGLLVAVVICAVITLLSLTIATSAATIGMEGSYDMPPAQTQQFLGAAAQKLGGKPAEPGSYTIPVLPWSTVTLKATVTPQAEGSRVTFYGHATKLKELKQLLDKQLPPLK